MHRLTRRWTVLASTAVAAAAVAAPASAQAAGTPAARPAATHVDVHRFAKQSGAGTYWTSDRMRRATDRTKKLPHAGRPKAGVPTGRAAAVAGQQPVLRAGIETPRRTIGKVFFTMNGRDYVCSANSVTANNRSVVATAGHCVNEGGGAYAQRFIFVPAYQNGSAPYGRWAGVSVATPREWSQSGDINQDTAFVTVARNNGVALADRVGATGVAFNQPRGARYTSYGYPAGAPFNGETLRSCTGTATADSLAGSTRLSQGIPCDMTGGSSGGPWFLGSGYAGTSSMQNSVNSYGYDGRNYMYGPYWGTKIMQSYTTASNSTAS